MNVVSFFAPRPDHPFYQDYTPFLAILEESCRRYGHRHLVLTDDPKVGSGKFDLFLTDLPHSLMKATLAAQLAYLRSEHAREDTLFVGADCVLGSDPGSVFDLEFDVAFTTGNFRDCILNTGAIFIRGNAGAAKFWELALSHCGDGWGDDQLSLADEVVPTLRHGVYRRLGLSVRFLPVDPYNLAPDRPDQDCSHAAVLHFRGPRKEWMADYCSRWLGIGEPIEIKALPNTSDEVIWEHVRANSLRNLPWVTAQSAHERHAVIVGGGPSIADDLGEIKRRRDDGQVIFALNGVAGWLADHGVAPDYQVLLDPRRDNLRFVDPPRADTFLVASQCHPDLFNALAGHDVVLFHPANEGIEAHIGTEKPALLIGGGVTVGLTAMALVYALGYRLIHLYGYDSSDREGEAHAYSQDETDPEKRRMTAFAGARKFTGSLPMVKQAQLFLNFAPMLADAGALITVHGDGLLPALARQMAGLPS